MTILTPKGPRAVGGGHPCFIVAEMSANHNQSFDKAVQIIEAVAASGADAIKIQTYTPDTITIDCNNRYFQVGGNDNPDFWEGKTLYALFQTAYTPWEWQPKLKEIAESLGLTFFSMSVDETGIDFLESMNVALYKIGSYELTNIPLLRRIGRTKKPVIMSVGYGSESEIEEAVETLRTHGTAELALLHCVTAYADHTKVTDMHLRNIRDLSERFNVVSGFSENAGGINGVKMAVLAGASIVEKHVILHKADGGPDAAFSIDVGELKEMVGEIRLAEAALGIAQYGPVNNKEEYNRDWCRESLFVVKDIQKGEPFTQENLRIIRPGRGLAPKEIDRVIGKNAARDIARGTPMSFDLIS